jgi:hypothetical protein
MIHRKTLFAAGSLLALSGIATAQTAENGSGINGLIDYNSNFQPLHDSGLDVIFGGQALFAGLVAPVDKVVGFGDSIRRCYGIDSTQGGRFNAGGDPLNTYPEASGQPTLNSFEPTWLVWTQGYGPNNPRPGPEVGLVSVRGAVESDITGDVCLSPWYTLASSTQAAESIALAVPVGYFQTPAAPIVPWNLNLQVLSTSTVVGSSVLAFDPNYVQHPANPHPLLVNVIYEVQGPLNSFYNNKQYYFASTTEVNGRTITNPGGVTNGNASWGTGVWVAPDPVNSEAITHSRLFVTDRTSAHAPTDPVGFAPTILGLLNTPLGSSEMMGHLAFQTPAMWATNNGNDGAGGPDWSVGGGSSGTAPVSRINLRLMDNWSAGEQTSNIYANIPNPGGPATAGAIHNPNIILQFPFFVWSGTASGSAQRPLSWDDGSSLTLCGAPCIQPQAGDFLTSTADKMYTRREGRQTIPATYDSLFAALLPVAFLTIGTPFSATSDFTHDGGVFDSDGFSNAQDLEGLFSPIVSGISKLPLGGLPDAPILGAPDPSLVGLRIGLGAIVLQFRVEDFYVAEVSSALTVTFQN